MVVYRRLRRNRLCYHAHTHTLAQHRIAHLDKELNNLGNFRIVHICRLLSISIFFSLDFEHYIVCEYLSCNSICISHFPSPLLFFCGQLQYFFNGERACKCDPYVGFVQKMSVWYLKKFFVLTFEIMPQRTVSRTLQLCCHIPGETSPEPY